MSQNSAPFLQITNDLPASASVLVAAFEGWNDAGDAASIAAKHLSQIWDGAACGHIEPEEFFDFSTTRPRVELADNRTRRIRWPDVTIWGGKIDEERNGLIVTGSEPQLRWRTFAQQVVEVATRCGVDRVITLGALLAEVPHTRPVPVFGSSESPTLAKEFQLEPSSYEGPTGIVGVLNAECAKANLDVVSLWAAVPSYLPGAASPKAGQALLRRLGPIVGSPINTESLDSASAAYEQQVGEMVAEDEATQHYVRQLEEHQDDEAATSLDEGFENADPQEMVAELEQFLREHD